MTAIGFVLFLIGELMCMRLFTELLRRTLENTVKSPVERYTLQETRAKPLTTQGN